MTQQKITVSEALRRAQEEEEDVFLGTFTRQEIERTGFDTSPPFDSFEVVDVYLMWDGSEYVLKYVFDGDIRFPYYEKESEIGGRDSLIDAVKEYLAIGGEKHDH